MKKDRFISPVIVGLIFIGGTLFAWYMIAQNQKKMDRLPVYTPADVNDSLVDPSLQNKGTGHRIADFELTDQYGRKITQKNLEGKIYVTDFFFVNCGTICPKMSSQLERVQEKYMHNSQVAILSHSVMPETDTVEALQVYAAQHGAVKDKWFFLTGKKSQIYDLARKSYFVVKAAPAGIENGGQGDFIHTENFVLVDTKKRIRGYYDGTSPKDVDRLLKDMDKLLYEENNP